MLVVTTAVVEGKPVKEYLGIVTGDAILGANIFRDLFASVRDIVGGRPPPTKKSWSAPNKLLSTK